MTTTQVSASITLHRKAKDGADSYLAQCVPAIIDITTDAKGFPVFEEHAHIELRQPEEYPFVVSDKKQVDAEKYPGYVTLKSTNEKQKSSESRVRLVFRDLADLTLVYGSFAEKTYDYLMLSKLDTELPAKCVASNSAVAYHTSGKQSAVIDKEAVYTGIDPEKEHFIDIVFRKDTSTDLDDDCGYVAIPSDEVLPLLDTKRIKITPTMQNGGNVIKIDHEDERLSLPSDCGLQYLRAVDDTSLTVILNKHIAVKATSLVLPVKDTVGKGGTQTVTVPVSVTSNGKDGESPEAPVLYTLYSNITALALTRNDLGQLTGSYVISPKIKQTTGTKTVKVDPGKIATLKVDWHYEHQTGGKGLDNRLEGDNINISVSVNSLAGERAVVIRLMDLENKVLDTLTLPVTRDGSKGRDGINYSLSPSTQTLIRREKAEEQQDFVVYCSMIKTNTDGTFTVYDDDNLPSKFAMTYQLNGKQEVAYEAGADVTVQKTDADYATLTSITFRLLYDGNVIETSVISVLREGGQGEDGRSLIGSETLYIARKDVDEDGNPTPPALPKDTQEFTAAFEEMAVAITHWNTEFCYLWGCEHTVYSKNPTDEFRIIPPIIKALGEQGPQGFDGCITRRSEWEAGKEYRNDTDKRPEECPDGIRYIDEVTVSTYNSGQGRKYLCMKTHTANSENMPQDNQTETSEHWQPLSPLKALSAPFADISRAFVQFLQANQIVITDPQTQLSYAAFGAATDTNPYPLWLGATKPSKAPFWVNKYGEIYTTLVRKGHREITVRANHDTESYHAEVSNYDPAILSIETVSADGIDRRGPMVPNSYVTLPYAGDVLGKEIEIFAPNSFLSRGKRMPTVINARKPDGTVTTTDVNSYNNGYLTTMSGMWVGEITLDNWNLNEQDEGSTCYMRLIAAHIHDCDMWLVLESRNVLFFNYDNASKEIV